MIRNIFCIFLEMNAKIQARKLDWKLLTKIDSKLLERYVDSETVKAHKVHLDQEETLTFDDATDAVESFLNEQYEKSLQVVSFDLVNYIPSSDFSQLASLLKKNLKRGMLIEGISGFLSELPDAEHVAGVNDFSLITRSHFFLNHQSESKLFDARADFIY